MMTAVPSLRGAGVVFMLVSALAGAVATALWLRSSAAWERHLLQADHTGALLFDSLVHDAPLPAGMQVVTLDAQGQTLADAGKFEQIAGLPRPALVTNLSISTTPATSVSTPGLQIALVSPKLRFPLSELDLSGDTSPRATMGALVALVATYCSEAVILAKINAAPWQQYAAPQVWACGAAPADYRLLAILLAAIALAGLAGVVVSTAGHFTHFADQLASRRSLSGPNPYTPTGPYELRRIVGAFNRFRERERQHLSERALVLSGVTHDLGTPAQRLKLRAALIEDKDLRDKLVADIDRMTGIIESVLTYTRAELNTEEARRLSLTSLVEAVVTDYRDTGQPVAMPEGETLVVEGGQSIFMSRKGKSAFQGQGDVIVSARPIALQRALTNLIENALKYGRRASVRIESDTTHAHILVEDAGGPAWVEKLEQMTAPFQRGENAMSIDGFGMGLTIVSAIAIEHGGALTFEPGREGAIARISLMR